MFQALKKVFCFLGKWAWTRSGSKPVLPPDKGKEMKRTLMAAVAVLLAGGAFAADLGGALVKVGSDTTSPPMESVDQTSGQIVGFDVDVVNAICAKINCKAEFVTTGWDGIFAALGQGQFNLVASGVSITDERKQTMDFSDNMP